MNESENRTQHLEPRDLAGEYPVLDDRIGAGTDDQIDERRELGIDRLGRHRRRRFSRHQRPPVGHPHGRRVLEQRRPPRDHAGRDRGNDQFEPVRTALIGPRERGPERTCAEVFGEEPRGAPDNRGGTPAHRLCGRADEGTQLGDVKGLALLRLHGAGDYFFEDLRLP